MLIIDEDNGPDAEMPFARGQVCVALAGNRQGVMATMIWRNALTSSIIARFAIMSAPSASMKCGSAGRYAVSHARRGGRKLLLLALALQAIVASSSRRLRSSRLAIRRRPV